MAVVTGGVTSRVGDVPGDSGPTWPRSQQRRGAQEGLPVAATKQQQTARQRRTVCMVERSDASGEASGDASGKEREMQVETVRAINHTSVHLCSFSTIN